MDIDRVGLVNAYKTFSDSFIAFECVNTERDAKSVKVYCSDAVPSLLQTVNYRLGSLRYKGIDEEFVMSGLKNLQSRQDLLWDGKHSFHFIVPQAVLYTLATSKNDHLIHRTFALLQIPLAIKYGVSHTL